MNIKALKCALLLLLTNFLKESFTSEIEICEGVECETKSFRTKRGHILRFPKFRSLKDPFDKEDVVSNYFNMESLRGKIDDAGNGIVNYRSDRETRAKGLEREADTFEIELLKQKAIFSRLQKDIGELKDNLIARGIKIGKLSELREEEMENSYFSFSNNTCGEVMVSKTGAIAFEDLPLSERHKNEYKHLPSSNCIWTIRTNHHSLIKITTHSLFKNHTNPLKKPKNGKAYLVELDSNSINPFNVKITELKSKGAHVCTGPIVFLVYSLNPYENGRGYADLNVQFEGIDRSLSRTTHYSHETVHSHYGLTFNSSALYEKQTANQNFTDQYSTIVVSRFATKIVLDIDFNRTQCNENDTLIVLNSLQSTNQSGYDCCKVDCKMAFVAYDSPILMIITNKFNKSLDFMFRLKMDAIHPLSSQESALGSYSCGGVIGGVRGAIDYKNYNPYSDRERCIWTIVPQPVPKSSINITLIASGVESFYDHLYMMEITDINGTILEDAPKITRLELDNGNYYQANSRELYIVFYSDDFVTGTGFSLEFEVVGEHDANLLEFMDGFSNEQKSQGNVFILQTLSSKYRRTISLTPMMVPDAYENIMRVKIKQQYMSQTNDFVANYGKPCVTHPNVNLFTTKKGIFTRSELNSTCNPSNLSTITLVESSEEMALVVLTNIDGNTEDVQTVISWEVEPAEGAGNNSYVVTDENKCGGVITGPRGAIRYKPAKSYLNNQRCIWTILAPNKTHINFTMTKDGLEKCCDFIVATGVDADLGILSPNRIIINRENSTATINGSAAVIVFQTDSATTGTGFILLFETFGNDPDSNYTYTAIHKEELDSYIPPRTSLEPVETSSPLSVQKNILIYTYNNKSPIKITGKLKQSKFRNWKNSSDEVCEYESLSGYTIDSPDSNSDNGWKKLSQPFDPSLHQIRATLPEVEETTTSSSGDDDSYANYYNDYTDLERETIHRWKRSSPYISETRIDDGTNDGSGSGWSDYDNVNSESGSGLGADGSIEDLAVSLDTVLTCQNMVEVSPIDNWINTDFGAFIVIYKSFYPNPQVEFEWKKGTTCGGVIVGESGVIDYKENKPYNANERCMWLVKVPGASRVQFSLVNHEFENCCDYVSLASIDPISGNVGSLSYLGKRGSGVTAQVYSSLVIVFFKSDSSQNGFGFRLNFNKHLSASRAHPFEYRLISENQADNHEFATRMEPNEMLIMAVQGLAESTQYIRTSVFRPRVNQDCASDQLSFYQFPHPDYGIRVAGSRMQASNVFPASLTTRRVDNQCPAVTDAELSQCSKIELCSEKPPYTAYAYTSAYFLVYKPITTSVNTTANSKMRGFAFLSSIRYISI